MKRVAYFSLGWSLAASPEEQEKDKARIRALLEEIGLERKFNPNVNWCPIEVEVGSRAFEVLIQASGENDVGRLSRIERRYAPQELESAPLLIWGPTNQAIEDDYYTLHFKEGQSKGIAPYTRNCEVCSAPLEQVRDMWVPVEKMGKRDLSLTYGFEVILSARLAQMLQESGLTGFTLRPAWNYRKPYQGEPRLFQLVVTNTLPPMASPPTEFEEDWPRPKQCDVCGRRAYYLKHTHYWGRIRYYEDTDIYYPKDVIGVVQDFNIAAERFGELRGSHQLIIITQRVYRWLREQKVKGWTAEPVYLVE